MTEFKSNCPYNSKKCEDVEHGYYKQYPKNVVRTNLVSEATSKNFEQENCTNYRIHQLTTEPQDNVDNTRTVINKKALTSLSQDFCEIGKTGIWASHDPRLRLSVTGQHIGLDRAPYTTNVTSKNMYDSNLNNFGQKYKSYSDIKGGQIQYYTDKHLQDTFFEPLFVSKSRVTNSTFIDPMGGSKAQYDKDVSLTDNKHISEYSFDRDQIAFRENLMASQMSKMNESDWSKMWK